MSLISDKRHSSNNNYNNNNSDDDDSELCEVFRVFDVNDDGRITASELSHVLHCLDEHISEVIKFYLSNLTCE